ncbi:hypothetical protein [Salipiger sp. PrR003]|uniref:hypothetical protein n=1 Tax=Salipiger sp. PrR003 TaxID=2706776 RepID=UPI0013DD7249|nr:hypothetical protein [Salipiger sp. PrR003]NDV52630.1 hypothetical protein [Salipiger sp. PrR003]
MAYVKRTCSNCGFKDIQPNMVQKTFMRNVGSSQASMNGATVLGAMLGNKSSTRRVQSVLFNNGQRTHRRKTTAWFCSDCAKKVTVKDDFSWSSGKTYLVLFVLALIFLAPVRDFTIGILHGIGDGLSSKSTPDEATSGNQPTLSSEDLTALEGLPEGGDSFASGYMGPVHGETDVFGGDIFPLGLSDMTIQDCLAWCEKVPDCVAISYVDRRKECYPKNALSEPRAAKGVVAAIKQ